MTPDEEYIESRIHRGPSQEEIAERREYWKNLGTVAAVTVACIVWALTHPEMAQFIAGLWAGWLFTAGYYSSRR